MQFVPNRHLLAYSFFCFLPLSLAYLEATEKPHYEAYCQINFWTIQENGGEKLVEDHNKQALIEAIKSNNIPKKYSKTSYQVKANRPSWPSVLKFLQESNIESSNPWLDLKLTYLEKFAGFSLLPDSHEKKVAKPFTKTGMINTNIDIIITKKNQEKTRAINVVVENRHKKLLEKDLLVYPTTTIDDLECFFTYHSDILPEEINTVLLRFYSIREETNQPLKRQPGDYRMKKMEDIHSNQLTWKQQTLTCSFYLNKNGDLLSEDQVSDSSKRKKGIEGEWKCINVDIGEGELLWPVVRQLVPNTSMMDISFKIISSQNNRYTILKRGNEYFRDQIIYTAYSMTVSINYAKESEKFVLVKYKSQSETKIKCILKQEGNANILLEEMLCINRVMKARSESTNFIEAYMYLLDQAGYLINSIQVKFPSITYKFKENNSQEKNQVEYIYMEDSMFDHQKDAHIESYTFIIPKNARLTKRKAKDQNKDVTINFWTIKKDGGERLLAPKEYEALAKHIVKNGQATEYQRRSYSIQKEEGILPTLLKLTKELKGSPIKSWEDLKLLVIKQNKKPTPSNPTKNWEYLPIPKLIKSGFIQEYIEDKGNNWHVIVDQKAGKKSIKTRLMIEKHGKTLFNKALTVYPMTTLTELMCHIKVDNPKVADEFFREVTEHLYILKAQNPKYTNTYKVNDALELTVEALVSNDKDNKNADNKIIFSSITPNTTLSPKNNTLEQKMNNESSNVIPNNHRQDPKRIPQSVIFTIITLLVIAAASLVTYLIWKQKKLQKKVNSKNNSS